LQHRLQLPHLGRGELARATTGLFRSQRRRPPAASARRYRFVGILLTRNRRATSGPWAPASIRSAADNRTCSRAAQPGPFGGGGDSAVGLFDLAAG